MHWSKIHHFSLRSFSNELCKRVTSASTNSWTTLPFTLIKLATLFFEPASLRCFVLESMRAKSRLYLSSNLKYKNKKWEFHRGSHRNDCTTKNFLGYTWLYLNLHGFPTCKIFVIFFNVCTAKCIFESQ